MSREDISSKTIDEILEQVQQSKDASPQRQRTAASDSEVDSILSSLGIEDTSRERPHIQFTSPENLNAMMSGQIGTTEKPTPIKTSAQMGRFVPTDSIAAAAPPQPKAQKPVQPIVQNQPASPVIQNQPVQPAQPVMQSKPTAQNPQRMQPVSQKVQIINSSEGSDAHEETSTLELPTIKAYTTAQEQREEDIKQKAARDALVRAGVNPEPYAPAPEQYNAGQYQAPYIPPQAQPYQAVPEAIKTDFAPVVPGAKTAPEQIGNAMFGEVDERFRDFFKNSIAQDSPEAEQEAYNRQKQRKKKNSVKKFLTNIVRDEDETFLTEEFAAQLPKKFEKIPIEVTLTQEAIMNGATARVPSMNDMQEPEMQEEYQPANNERGGKFKSFTIKMPIGAHRREAQEPVSHAQDEYRNTEYLAAETSEYNHVSDAPAVSATLKNMRVTRVMRMVVKGFITLALLYFGFSSRTGGLPAIAAFDPHTEPFAFLIVNFVLLSIAMLTCLTTLGTGMVGLFKRPTTDTFVALAAASAFIQNLAYLFKSADFNPEKITLFAPIVVFLLFANTLGKWLQSKVVSDNFEFASAERRHSAAFIVQNQELARKVCSGIGEPSPLLLLSRPAGLVKHFLRQSFSQHKTDLGSKTYAYIMLGAAFVCAVLCGWRSQSFFEALSGFAAALCVAAPLASTLVYALPSLFLQQEAAAVEAVIPGPSAITELGETNVVLLNARDIFPVECVRMHGIKTFEKARLDHTILYGASLINRCCDTLRAPFMALVDNKPETLYKVENEQFEAGLGYVAWIDGKRVIMGSRTMMQRHSIEIPSLEYEGKYTLSGQRSPVYLAVAGKAYGMFIVSYTPDAAAQSAIDELGDAGINIILQTDDFNITGTLVGATYSLRKATIKVLSQSEQGLLASQTAYVHEASGVMIHNGTCASFLGGLRAAARAAENESLSSTVQTAAIIFSLIMCLVLSFSNGLTGVALLAVVLYHIGWCALTAVLPILLKRKRK